MPPQPRTPYDGPAAHLHEKVRDRPIRLSVGSMHYYVEGTSMKLSTRNQLPGTVISVTTGEAMAVIKIRLDGGAEITSSITKDAADDLGLAEGSKVTALIKATEVALAVE